MTAIWRDLQSSKLTSWSALFFLVGATGALADHRVVLLMIYWLIAWWAYSTIEVSGSLRFVVGLLAWNEFGVTFCGALNHVFILTARIGS